MSASWLPRAGIARIFAVLMKNKALHSGVFAAAKNRLVAVGWSKILG